MFRDEMGSVFDALSWEGQSKLLSLAFFSSHFFLICCLCLLLFNSQRSRSFNLTLYFCVPTALLSRERNIHIREKSTKLLSKVS